MTNKSTEKQDKDDPVALFIIDYLAGCREAPAPDDIARALYRHKGAKPQEKWHKYLPAVRQQALFLARKGRITILRRGMVTDPNKPVKGLIRLALSEESAEI